MCLKETYSKVRIGKQLCDSYPFQNDLKQWDALSPLLFNFVFENQVRLKLLNGTRQFLVYADDVILLENNINTINKNSNLIDASNIWERQ
jgi:hypothetical protein